MVPGGSTGSVLTLNRSVLDVGVRKAGKFSASARILHDRLKGDITRRVDTINQVAHIVVIVACIGGTHLWVEHLDITLVNCAVLPGSVGTYTQTNSKL